MNKLYIAAYVAATSLALILLKFGSLSGSPIYLFGDKLQINLNIYVFSGIALYGISFLLYMYLISKYDLGYIIPLATAFVYIVIFVASFAIFKESFTLIKVLAILLIISGLVLLNTHK